MSNMKCPFCQQELEEETFARGRVFVSCNNPNCIISDWGGCSKQIITELIHTRKTLEQSEICCTEWEKQALDYKAENIALSGKLERTRKALDAAKKWLMEIGYLNMSEHGLGSEKMMTDWCKTVALHGLKEIETALEQKDVK